MESEINNIKINLKIPKGLDFSDLNLAFAGEDITLNWEPIEKICEACGIDAELYKEGPEDYVVGLIGAWYFAHLKNGGGRDEVADELFAEELAQETIQNISFSFKT